MSGEAVQPRELVRKFWSRLRIAVRCVERGYDHPVDCRLDVAAFPISDAAWQLGARQNRRRPAREYGDAIPALLPAPDRLVACAAYRVGRELRICRLELLQADHIRLGHIKPAQEIDEALIDVVDVECRYLHRFENAPRNPGIERGSAGFTAQPSRTALERSIERALAAAGLARWP